MYAWPMSDPPLRLIPEPRRLVRHAGQVMVPRGQALVSGDIDLVRSCLPGLAMESASQPDQAWLRAFAETPRDGPGLSCEHQRYYLRIAPPEPGSRNAAAVNIRSDTRAGLRHGLMTFRQLLKAGSGRLPCLEIEDGPSFATRGVMLDVSRCRIPTMAQLYLTIDILAELKVNHLQLYTEHTFAYAGHEAAWQGWSPLTADEVRNLDACCQERGIDLAPNQNCFGHLAHWLRMPRYAGLAETHGDWMFDVWPRSGPFSLCPTDPQSLTFVQDLLGQLLPCFTSHLVNIGCDETFDVGWGRSKGQVERQGRAAVYLEFVSKVADLARRAGKRPMFWADIALSYPDCIEQIPPDLLALVWGYEPDAPFEKWCGLLRDAGREVWVCPGTSSWRSIAGRTSERRQNIAAAARHGLAGDAAGLLVCDWGDTGHHQVWPIAAMGIAHGAAAAWNADASMRFDPVAASIHALGDPTGSAGPWLESLGDSDLPLREVCLGLSRPGLSGRLRNQGALFADLHNCSWDQSRDVGDPGAWQTVRNQVQVHADAIPTRLHPLLEDELRHTVDVMAFAADRAVARRQAGNHAQDRVALRERLVGLIAEHRRLWLLRSRPGGLDQSIGFYRKVRDDLTG